MNRKNVTYVIAGGIVAWLAVGTTLAKKPDWPGTGGAGVIGFGLVELTPRKVGNAYTNTSFLVEYTIPQRGTTNLKSSQIIVLPAAALEKYNNIPESEAIARVAGTSVLADGSHSLAIRITIDKPGLFAVCYGPYDGLLIFDEDESGPLYKISVTSDDTGAIRWVDQDAGDVTVFPMVLPGEGDKAQRAIRVRLLRNREAYLKDKTLFKIQEFKLHKTAIERVKLIDASW